RHDASCSQIPKPRDDASWQLIAVLPRHLPQLGVRMSLYVYDETRSAQGHCCNQRPAGVEQPYDRLDECAREALHLADFIDEVDAALVESQRWLCDALERLEVDAVAADAMGRAR